jgi:signal peptidase I
MSLLTHVLVVSVRRALTIGLIVMIVVAISAGLHFERRGGVVLNVQTGSMRPIFRPGDAVIAWRVPPRQLQVGDIISYHSLRDPRVIISHRLISKQIAGGVVQLITKGDAVPTVDPPIGSTAVTGQVWAVAPGLGKVLGWIKTPYGLGLAIYLPALVIIGLQAKQVVRYYRPTRYRLLHR